MQNVEVVAEAEAAAALARSVGADAALLLADDDTVSLTVVGEDEESTSVLASVPIGAAGAAVACAAVLQQVSGPEVTRIMLVGQRLDLDSIAAELRSTAPVEVPPDAGYAIARGAAQTVEDSGFPAGAATQMAPVADATLMAPARTRPMATGSDATQMAPAAADATQMAPASDPAAVGPQLAYSQDEEPGDYEMPADSLEEFVPEQEDEAPYTAVIAPPPPRTLLMGSALAFVVISFATLAVTVAINIRPAADVKAQPVPAIQSDTVPGRYLPPVPHEPDPVALPIAVVSPPPAAPAAPSVPTNRGPVTNDAPSAPRAGGTVARAGSCAAGAGGPDSAGHHSSAVEPVPPADVPDDANDRDDDADDNHHHDNDHDDHDDADHHHDNADDHHDDVGAFDDSVVAVVDRDGCAGNPIAGVASARVHPTDGAGVHTAGGARVHPAGGAGVHAACRGAGACASPGTCSGN